MKQVVVPFSFSIHIKGQTKSVSIIHILGKDTLDEVVLTALGDKEETQTGLMDKIKQYRESKR